MKTYKIVINDVEVTVEQLARAYASIDGKAKEFDAGKAKVQRYEEDYDGHYEGYITEMEEILKRASNYQRTLMWFREGFKS